VEAVRSGFFWGDCEEDSKAVRHCRNDELHFEAGSWVRLVVTGEVQRQRTYLGVTLPHDLLVANVRLPDGTPLSETRAKIDARCDATLVTPRTHAEAWDTLSICVRVDLDGYAPLGFVATATEPSPVQTLVPIARHADE
jgi:hypothetical protein